jgi:hypothetical protein
MYSQLFEFLINYFKKKNQLINKKKKKIKFSLFQIRFIARKGKTERAIKMPESFNNILTDFEYSNRFCPKRSKHNQKHKCCTTFISSKSPSYGYIFKVDFQNYLVKQMKQSTTSNIRINKLIIYYTNLFIKKNKKKFFFFLAFSSSFLCN